MGACLSLPTKDSVQVIKADPQSHSDSQPSATKYKLDVAGVRKQTRFQDGDEPGSGELRPTPPAELRYSTALAARLVENLVKTEGAAAVEVDLGCLSAEERTELIRAPSFDRTSAEVSDFLKRASVRNSEHVLRRTEGRDALISITGRMIRCDMWTISEAPEPQGGGAFPDYSSGDSSGHSSGLSSPHRLAPNKYVTPQAAAAAASRLNPRPPHSGVPSASADGGDLGPDGGPAGMFDADAPPAPLGPQQLAWNSLPRVNTVSLLRRVVVAAAAATAMRGAIGLPPVPPRSRPPSSLVSDVISDSVDMHARADTPGSLLGAPSPQLTPLHPQPPFAATGESAAAAAAAAAPLAVQEGWGGFKLPPRRAPLPALRSPASSPVVAPRVIPDSVTALEVATATSELAQYSHPGTTTDKLSNAGAAAAGLAPAPRDAVLSVNLAVLRSSQRHRFGETVSGRSLPYDMGLRHVGTSPVRESFFVRASGQINQAQSQDMLSSNQEPADNAQQAGTQQDNAAHNAMWSPEAARAMREAPAVSLLHLGAHVKLGPVLGRGADATVYKATVVETGEVLAVKHLTGKAPHTAEFEKMWMEMAMLRNFSHPNIIRYRGIQYDEEHREVHILLEYVPHDLQTLVAIRRRFTEHTVAFLMKQLLRGLSYLHSKKIIHRDMKPANVLVSDSGVLKITDFGVSTLVSDAASVRRTCIGTPYYTAPEVISCEPYSYTADIWSVGCCCVELLSGKRPYSDLNEIGAMFQMVENKHPALPSDASNACADFLARCFIREPAERPTADQLLSHPFLNYARFDAIDLFGDEEARSVSAPLPYHAPGSEAVASPAEDVPVVSSDPLFQRRAHPTDARSSLSEVAHLRGGGGRVGPADSVLFPSAPHNAGASSPLAGMPATPPKHRMSSRRPSIDMGGSAMAYDQTLTAHAVTSPLSARSQTFGMWDDPRLSPMAPTSLPHPLQYPPTHPLHESGSGVHAAGMRFTAPQADGDQDEFSSRPPSLGSISVAH